MSNDLIMTRERKLGGEISRHDFLAKKKKKEAEYWKEETKSLPTT